MSGWIRHNPRWVFLLRWQADRNGWEWYRDCWARMAFRGLAHHKSQRSFLSTMEMLFFVPMRFNAIMDKTVTQLQGEDD